MESARSFVFDEFRFDMKARVLFRNEQRVEATPKALEILAVLLENAGEVVSKEELMQRAWPDSFVEEANLSHHIFRLRKALGEEDDRKVIETIPKRGYRLAVDVRPVDAAVREGSHQPRNLIWKVSIALGLVLLVTTLGWLLFSSRTIDDPPGTISDVRSIAVLPFTNESGNQELDYLADGIGDTLISSLSRIQSLRVKSRSAVSRYKDKEPSAPTVGTDLGVQAVVYGRITQRGEDLTLFLSLIDTKTENQLWGKQYVRRLSDLVTLQREIGYDVAQSLQARLTGADENRLTRNYSRSSEAYRQYLLGKFYWNKFTADGMHKAIDCFQKAIVLDGDYALAHAGLGNAYSVLGVNGHIPVREAAPKSRFASQRAVELDDNLAEGHLALGGHKMFFEWDLSGAEIEFKRAMELDPNFAQPHELYAYALRSQRRFDEAIAEAQNARELEPLSLLVNGNLATCYRFAGRIEEAVEINNHVIEMDPNFAEVRFENALAHSQLGNHEIALEEIMRGLALSGNSTHVKAGLGIVYAGAGRKASAQRVIDELVSESGSRYVSPLDIALVYSSMGERDKAFDWLSKAFEERSAWLIELNVDPQWAAIRDDSRFQELVARVGLAE